MLSIGIVIVSILAVAYLIFKNTTLPVLFCLSVLLLWPWLPLLVLSR